MLRSRSILAAAALLAAIAGAPPATASGGVSLEIAGGSTVYLRLDTPDPDCRVEGDSAWCREAETFVEADAGGCGDVYGPAFCGSKLPDREKGPLYGSELRCPNGRAYLLTVGAEPVRCDTRDGARRCVSIEGESYAEAACSTGCRRTGFAGSCTIAAWAAAGGSDDRAYDLVVRGGRAIDPETGLDAIRDVGIDDGTIEEVSASPLRGRRGIDARGKVVAPGFIDLNTYQHGDPLFRLRAADGVTSVLHMEGGAVDVGAYYEALAGRALIHHGVAASHPALRQIAAGVKTLEIAGGVTESRGDPEVDRRRLTAEELDRLLSSIERELRQGAVGVGFGLAYSPGASHSEILRVVGLAARYDAPAHLHVREFDSVRDWGETYEVAGLAIETGADVHVTHANSVYGSSIEDGLAFFERARAHGLSISTECYPYAAGLTFVESALFDDWRDWPDEAFERYEWPPTGERLTRESFERYRERGGVILLHPDDPEARARAVRACVVHPLTMIASDGAWDRGMTHPRSAGTNSRILGRYVREEGALTLIEALRKMTLAPALHLERRVPGMRRKGRLQVGADADLVVFDAETVLDRATYRDPLLPPVGIETVIVAGVPVVAGGEVLPGVHPGRPIRGPVVEGAGE